MTKSPLFPYCDMDTFSTQSVHYGINHPLFLQSPSLNMETVQESHNSLKLSFTNIQDLHSNFVDCESFLESNPPDILALCVSIPRCYKDVNVSSFFPCTARLWNSLPTESFPLTYDISGFKSRINRHILTRGSF